MPLGPDERILFEEQATPLYEEIVTSGGIDAADTRIAKRGELHAAFELLAEVGLVDQERRRHAPGAPSTRPPCRRGWSPRWGSRAPS